MPGKPDDALGECVVQEHMIGVSTAEHGPKALPPTAPATTALLAASTASATITMASNPSMESTECTLATD